MICVPVTATVIGNDSYKLNIAGSTTMQPLMVEFQKDFEKFANVDMNVTGGGSGVGVSSTMNGIADIGMLSRDLKSGEGKGRLIVHVIGKDAVVVIVNASVDLGDTPNLTLNQLADIYSGKITNWKDINGSDRNISVNAREEGSGTKDCFEAALKTVDKGFVMKERGVNSVNSTGAIIATVNNTPGAIGYINLDVALKLQNSGSGENIRVVSVDGVSADQETVSKGDYKISRNLILVTDGDPKGIVKFFIDWIMSPNGQDIVEKEGFVRIVGVIP
jgi:phosphate transport system substrate-binding protein